LDEDFYFNESAELDILLTPDKALIPTLGIERDGDIEATLMKLRW
jgi:hypothetical protein